jgi:hypothetical protein
MRHTMSRGCQTIINRLTGDLIHAAPLIRSLLTCLSLRRRTSYRRIGRGRLWMYPVCRMDVQNCIIYHVSYIMDYENRNKTQPSAPVDPTFCTNEGLVPDRYHQPALLYCPKGIRRRLGHNKLRP